MFRFRQKLTFVFSLSILLSACDGAPKRVEGEVPFEPGSLMNMADSFLEAGDYSSAMRLYQRTARENADHVPSRLGLAMIYNKLGAADRAINFYQQVLVIDPENIAAKHGIGRSLLMRNRPKEAIGYLQEIAEKDANNHKIFNSLGLAHDLMGQSEKAQLNYGLGLNIKPDDISLLNNLALSFALEGQYAPSIRLLGKAINLDYSVTKAQQNLVMVYVMSGEEQTARKIGAGLMNDEELENTIKHYKWLMTLTAKQRAQAIYLGIKTFPKEKTAITPKEANLPTQAQPAEDIISEAGAEPLDPKKKQLLDILTSETKKEDVISDNLNEAKETLPLADENKNDIAEEKTEEEPEILQALIKGNHKPAADKIYLVQLGSYATEELAQTGWQQISRKNAPLLVLYSPLTRRVTLENGKEIVRLFIKEIEEDALARSTCQSLKDQGGDCLVLKTGRD